MTLKDMEEELDSIVEDDSLKENFKAWINAAILQIAADIELPAPKLLSPETLEVDNTAWFWEMPSSYHKKLFRCNFQDAGQTRNVKVFNRRDDLEYRDHTREEARITGVAVAALGEKHYLLIDPLPAAPVTLNLWYYCKPTVLVNPEDVCDCIPPEFHDRVIFPKVIIRNYQRLLDQVVSADYKSLSYWETEYLKGIRGAPGHPGLINFLAKTERPPRRTGGRDPAGVRPRYGY